MNSTFRREAKVGVTVLAASELIRLAVAHTRARWPDVPELGMVTFVNPEHVPGTKVRGETVYGHAYLKAGFRHVGFTEGGLWAWQMLPADMPDPAPAPPRGLTLDPSW